jgi:hypothetical protein
LISLSFQLEALYDGGGGGGGGGDDVAVVARAKNEPSKFDEVMGDHGQSGSPQNDADADADAERAEV